MVNKKHIPTLIIIAVIAVISVFLLLPFINSWKQETATKAQLEAAKQAPVPSGEKPSRSKLPLGTPQ